MLRSVQPVLSASNNLGRYRLRAARTFVGVAMIAGLALFATGQVAGASVPLAPTSVSVSSTAAGAVTVTWTDPVANGTAITGYQVLGASNAVIASTTNATATTLTFTPGASLSTTTIAVVATSMLGNGATSSPYTVGAPVTPTITTVTPGNGTVTVAFNQFNFNIHIINTSYTILANGNVAGTCATDPCTLTDSSAGLALGASYAFKVIATNPFGSSSASSASPLTQVAANPSAITNVVATVNNSAVTPNVTLTWNAPSSTGGTPVTYAVTDYNGNAYSCASALATTCVIPLSALINGLTYNSNFNGYGNLFDGTFTVTATNGSSLSSTGISNSVIAANPISGSLNLTLSSTQASWTNLFDVQADNDAEGFILQYFTCTGSVFSSCTASGSPLHLAASTTTWNYSSNGFTPPVNSYYGFSVTAFNQVGLSATSSAVIPTADLNTGAGPGAPTITSDTASNSTVSVSWTPNASNGGSALTGYSLQLLCGPTTGTISTCAGHNAVTLPATTTTFSFSALAPQYYEVTVTPVNAIGSGTSTTSQFEQVGLSPIGAVAGTSASTQPSFSYTPTTVTVSWSAPATGYNVNTITVADVTKSTTLCSAPVTALSCTVATTSVAASDVIDFVSTDAAGVLSEPSSTSSLTGLPSTTSLSLYQNANGIYMTWGSVSNALSYNLLGVGSDGSRITNSLPAGTTNYTLNYGAGGLTVGVTYAWQIDAANAFGASVYSSPNASYTTASTPTSPTNLFCDTTSTTLDCDWFPSSSSLTITGYIATLTWPNGQTTVVTAPALGAFFTGLTPITAYALSVVAVTPLGNSASSSVYDVTTIGTPSAPTGLTAKTDPSASGNQAILSWTPPTNLGGSALGLYYAVYEYVAGNPIPFNSRTCPATSATCTVGGLSSGTSYVFAIDEANIIGEGALATVSYASPTQPSAPSNVVATELPDGNYSISWTPSTDSALISQYNVYFFQTYDGLNGSSSEYQETYSSGNTAAPSSFVDLPYQFGSLTGNDQYSFSVVAVDSWGNDSAYSAPSPVYTYLVAPQVSPYIDQTSYGVPYSATTSPGGIAVSYYNSVIDDPSITSYTLELVGGPVPIVKTIPTTDTADEYLSYTFPASVLTSGVTYAAEIYSTNAHGVSATTTNNTQALAPSAPQYTYVAVEDASQTTLPAEIVVSWQLPFFTYQLPLTYTVVGYQNGLPTYSTTTSGYQVTVPYSSAYTEFTVTTTSVAGTSSPAVVLSSSGSWLTDPGAPTTPYTVSILQSAVGEVDLTYALHSYPTDPITSYTVTATPVGGGAAVSCPDFSFNATSSSECYFYPLSNQTTYTYSVVANSPLGSSPALTGTFTSGPDLAGTRIPSGQPVDGTGGTYDVPTITSVVPSLTLAGDETVLVTWTPPKYTGGLPITGYQVDVENSFGAFFCLSSEISTSTSCTIDVGSPDGPIDSVYVTPQTAAGLSYDYYGYLGSLALLPSSPAGPPATPLVSGGYGTLTSSAVGTLKITWVEPPSTQLPVTGFTIVPYDNTTGTFLPSVTVGAGSTSAILTGLPTGDVISPYVYADDMFNGVVTPSSSFDYLTWYGWTVPEAAPNISSVTLPSAGTETVTWSPPVPLIPGDEGSSVTGYVVTATNTTTGVVVSQKLSASVLSATFTGLPTGSTYTIAVAATNALGTGPYSEVTGSKASLAVPGAPKITGVTPTSSSLAISWSAPSTNGGSVITGYLVSVSAGNVTVTCGSVSATATTCTIPGLSSSTTYQVSVSALNANGPGAAASSSGTTAQAALTPANITVSFTAGSTALSTVTKNALVALAQKLSSGATLTLTGYAKGDTFLAKSRATTVALFLEAAVSNLKFQLREVITSSANAVTVVTVSN